jgi:hypothetical protein
MKNKKYIVAIKSLASLAIFFSVVKICSASVWVSMIPPTHYTTFQDLLLGILSYLRNIAGIIAVIFLVIGGIKYMFSMGNIQRVERAKMTVTYAIVGLAIVIAAPSFLKEIYLILGGNVDGSSGPTMSQILMNILNFLLSIIGFLSIISMIIGAIFMLTAYGDTDRVELGKKTVIYSIIGTAVALGALVIANQVSVLIVG